MAFFVSQISAALLTPNHNFALPLIRGKMKQSPLSEPGEWTSGLGERVGEQVWTPGKLPPGNALGVHRVLLREGLLGCIGRANSQALERGCSDTLHPQEGALKPASGTLHMGQKSGEEGFLGPASSSKSSLLQTLCTGACPEPCRERGEFLWLSKRCLGERMLPFLLQEASEQQRFTSIDICLFSKFMRPRVDQPQCGSYSGFKYAQHKHCIQCRSTPWVRGRISCKRVRKMNSPLSLYS